MTVTTLRASDGFLAWSNAVDEVALLPTDADVAGAAGEDPDFFWFDAQAEGSDWGDGGAIITDATSQLRDGSLSFIDSYENRTSTVRVRVFSRTYVGLSAGENRLMRMQQSPGYSRLRWTPNSDLAPISVLDVVFALMTREQSRDDKYGELWEPGGKIMWRTYVLTLTCRPFVHAEDAVTSVFVEDVQAAVQTITLSDGTDGANYTLDGNTGQTVTAVGVVDGAYRGLTTPRPGSGALTVLRFRWTSPSGSFSMQATPYFVVDYKVISGDLVTNITVSGADFSGETDAPRAGYRRAFFKLEDRSVPRSGVRFEFSLGGRSTQDTTIAIDQISRSNRGPVSNNDRIRIGTLDIAGTARTPVRLAARASSGSVGWLYLYTRAGEGYLQPSLRTTQGPTGTATSTAISGYTSNSVGATLFSAFVPEANYDLVAHCKAGTAGRKTFQVTVRSDTYAAGGEILWQETFTAEVPTTYGPIALSSRAFPIVAVEPDSLSTFVLSVQASDVTFDDVFMFDTDNGAYTIANLGSLAKEGKRFEIRPPDVNDPRLSYWASDTTGGAATNMYRAAGDVVKVPGVHALEPGINRCFVASTSKFVMVEETHFPAYHSYVPPVAGP